MLAAVVPGGNGVFRPLVLDDGVVVGTWRLPRTSRATPEPVIDLVERVSSAKRRAIGQAVADWPHG